MPHLSVYHPQISYAVGRRLWWGRHRELSMAPDAPDNLYRGPAISLQRPAGYSVLFTSMAQDGEYTGICTRLVPDHGGKGTVK